MELDLFTVVCEYHGGTYISQVRGRDEQQAMTEWAALLRGERPIEGASDRIARAVTESENTPVPLTGLNGVWCWTATVENEFVLTNIIRSARPKGLSTSDTSDKGSTRT